MQITRRDEEMLAWLQEVRLADLDAVRWALGALRGTGEPTGLRVAQHWVSRMVSAEYIGRARPAFQDGSIIWATYRATGRAAPNLMRQTTRHQVSVARASARFLAHGYTWANDRVATSRLEHRADGAAVHSGVLDLIEVELTPKTEDRYRTIFNSHGDRLQMENVGRVLYLCDTRSARAVEEARSVNLVSDLAQRVVIVDVLDQRGEWKFDWTPQLDSPAAGIDTYVSKPAPDDNDGRLLDSGSW